MSAKRYVLALGLMFGALAVSVAYAETLTELTNGAFSDPRQPPVPFLHDEHNEKAGLDGNCAFCHHVYEDDKRVADASSEDMACSECHQPVHFSQGVSLSAAFHKRCKGCHLDVKQGPIVCGQCHQSPERAFSTLP
jgi:hypothetical protein